MLDPDRLHAAILAATRAALAELLPQRDDHCGYALYSDAGAMTVCLALNTREHLARRTDDDSEWAPAEWAMEGVGDEHFDDLCDELGSVVVDLPDEQFEAFRDLVYESSVRALEDLVADGTLRTGDGHVVVFTVSDDWDPDRESRWIRRLNPPATADRHARWASA